MTRTTTTDHNRTTTLMLSAWESWAWAFATSMGDLDPTGNFGPEYLEEVSYA